MLGPSRSAPDYEKELKRYQQDSSDWGIEASKLDMMKSPLVQPQPLGPSAAAQQAMAGKR